MRSGWLSAASIGSTVTVASMTVRRAGAPSSTQPRGHRKTPSGTVATTGSTQTDTGGSARSIRPRVDSALGPLLGHGSHHGAELAPLQDQHGCCVVLPVELPDLTDARLSGYGKRHKRLELVLGHLRRAPTTVEGGATPAISSRHAAQPLTWRSTASGTGIEVAVDERHEILDHRVALVGSGQSHKGTHWRILL